MIIRTDRSGRKWRDSGTYFSISYDEVKSGMMYVFLDTSLYKKRTVYEKNG